MRKACHRIGVGGDGRPFCVHGPMTKKGDEWRCSVVNRLNRGKRTRAVNTAEKRRWRNRKDQALIDKIIADNPWLKEEGWLDG